MLLGIINKPCFKHHKDAAVKLVEFSEDLKQQKLVTKICNKIKKFRKIPEKVHWDGGDGGEVDWNLDMSHIWIVTVGKGVNWIWTVVGLGVGDGGWILCPNF